MTFRSFVIAALLVPVFGDVSNAQVLRRRDRIQQDGAPARQQLEQRLRTGMASVVRKRIGLNDAQMSKLAQTNARFDARRRELNRSERAQRVELRSQVVAGQGANQDRIASALDSVLRIQRDRIELQIEEQRELSAFMTPLQRARYAALQEQIRRRLQGVRTAAPKASADSD
jgi:hypothetical protein